MRELWAAEARYPVFAGSVNSFKVNVVVKKQKAANTGKKLVKRAKKRTVARSK